MGRVVVSIVEDDESLRQALTDLVNAIGFEAASYATAEAFLDSDARLATSCLITDIQLPGMTGLEMYRRLAALDAAIPTIFVTAIPGERIRLAALAHGALALLHKPIDGAALSRHIFAALKVSARKDG